MSTLPPLPEPIGFRMRYRSEPGMIGHYPWSYADRRRRPPQIRAEHECEDLFTADQLRAAIAAAVAAERAAILARLGQHYGDATALHLEFAAIRQEPAV